MVSFLLAIIYIAFISLGLPDSLLGSAWPVIQTEFSIPLSYAGIVSMIIAGCTIISSLFADRLIRRFGTGLLTALSVLMTAIALFGFSVSCAFPLLCLWAIPYGLGAGAVDSALNNFVALHYSARHMSWLHCFWGLGASIGPYIMGFSLATRWGWRGGYFSIFVIQIILTVLLFSTLSLWNRKKEENTDKKESTPPLQIVDAMRIPGVPFVLLAFFSYCAIEVTTSLWASSYLAEFRRVPIDTAASLGCLYYLGITFGRFLCGFIADSWGDRKLIRYGLLVIALGILLVALPLPFYYISAAGIAAIGFGCAPIYPSIIHSTPENFGEENSQGIIGIQMSSAYMGSTFVPPIFGLIANHIHIGLYPVFLGALVLLTFVMTEKLNKIKSA